METNAPSTTRSSHQRPSFGFLPGSPRHIYGRAVDTVIRCTSQVHRRVFYRAIELYSSYLIENLAAHPPLGAYQPDALLHHNVAVSIRSILRVNGETSCVHNGIMEYGTCLQHLHLKPLLRFCIRHQPLGADLAPWRRCRSQWRLMFSYSTLYNQ